MPPFQEGLGGDCGGIKYDVVAFNVRNSECKLANLVLVDIVKYLLICYH